jgi:type I restriction-modification system DNA methylase subunit
MEIERTKERVDKTGEVFTPKELVQEILSKLPEESFINPNKSFIDPACGDGNFLVEVLNLKLSKDHDILQALSNIYGIDIMEDNIKECKTRLLEIVGTHKQFQDIVDKNIKVGNALEIKDFEFFFS